MQSIKVQLISSDGTSSSYYTSIVGTDAQHDLAVLKIDAPDDVVGQMAGIGVGSSKDLKVGQSLFALGNPYGLTQTLSAGLVSGLNRSIPSPVGTRIYGVIQVKARIWVFYCFLRWLCSPSKFPLDASPSPVLGF